jgi:DNA-binding HxlR family transcriptional regulator
VASNDICMKEETVRIIAGKWNLTILYHLSGGTKRFNELRGLIPDITQKILTNQLRELEKQDIVRRVVYAQVPPKVEYSLTDYGKTLQPVMALMVEWGAAHSEHMEKKNADFLRSHFGAP